LKIENKDSIVDINSLILELKNKIDDPKNSGVVEDDVEEVACKDSLMTAAVMGGVNSTVQNFGNANQQFIIAYNGKNKMTGEILTRSSASNPKATGLKDIAEYRLGSSQSEQDRNINQQAGFSGEYVKVARDNANKAKKGEVPNVKRGDDIKELPINDRRIDIAEVDKNGKIINGTQCQMKILKNPKNLLKGIVNGSKGCGKYRGIDIVLPTEQVEECRQFCEAQAKELNKQAEGLLKQADNCNNQTKANELREKANEYTKLKDRIKDSGISKKDAYDARIDPKKFTRKEIIKMSNEAGMQGAKIGAAIGGGTEFCKQIYGVYKGDTEAGEAIQETLVATGKSAAIGYATSSIGSMTQAVMGQSEKQILRNLSKTSLPAQIIPQCYEITKLIYAYSSDEITGVEFFEQLGERGTGLVAGGAGTVLGQIIIPVPVVGAVIGSTIGYMMSSFFYKDTLRAFKDLNTSSIDYEYVKAECESARRMMIAYQTEMKQIFEEKLQIARKEIDCLLINMDIAIKNGNIDEFADHINRLGELIGTKLQFATFKEFNKFMKTDEPLCF